MNSDPIGSSPSRARPAWARFYRASDTKLNRYVDIKDVLSAIASLCSRAFKLIRGYCGSGPAETRSRRLADTWKAVGGHAQERRRGYVSNMVAAGRELLRHGPISRAAITAPEPGAELVVAEGLGLSELCVEDTGYDEIGVTGAAMPLLLLARALDTAAPGDRILLLAHGDGADAFLFEATAEIEGSRRPRAAFGSRRIAYPTYQVYRKLRGFLQNTDQDELSTVRWNHDETQNVRLHGTHCASCGTMQFPIPKVCVHCGAMEGLVEKPLSRTGAIYTFTKDTLYGGPVQPTVMAVVTLDDGARFLCQMTDVEEREVAIGMRVELVARRMKGSPSTNYYYWKCRPVREDAS